MTNDGEKSSGDAGSQGPGQQPPQAQRPDVPLILHTQYVRDLSFENPNAPGILANLRQAPALDIQLNVGARPLDQQQRLFEVVLNINVNAKAQDRAAFVTELEYGAVVTIGNMVPEERFETMLLIDCAAMLFPFARRIIADTTRDGGFPPVMINPVDFAQLYQQRKAQAPDAGAQTGGKSASEDAAMPEQAGNGSPGKN